MAPSLRPGGFKVRRVYRDGFFPQNDIFITKIKAASRSRAAKIAVKDNIATTSDIPTTCASRILFNYRSPFEAEVLSRLLSHGESVLLGKTKMDEFGMGSHSTHSLWGPAKRKSSILKNYSPGGSSGGSAIAVADNDCPIGIGTDTGGSVRLPAAYTGVVGFKPSYGLVSRRGVVPYANSLDTVGFFTKSVMDSQNLLEQTMGHDPRDPTSLSLKDRERIFGNSLGNESLSRLQKEYGNISTEFSSPQKKFTIGFPLEYNIKEIDPEILRIWKFTLKLLRTDGLKVVPVSLPTTKHALSAYYIIAPAEASSNLAKYDGVRYGSFTKNIKKFDDALYSRTRGDKLGPEVRRRILLGSYVLSSEAIDNHFIQAQKVRRLVQLDFDAVFKTPNPLREPKQFDLSKMHEDIPMADKMGPDKVDFILCPTAPTYPPKLDTICGKKPVETYMNDVFTIPASLAGLPSISIPVAMVKPSLFSAGMQVIGQYGSDFDLLQFSRQLERLIGQYHRDVTKMEQLVQANKIE